MVEQELAVERGEFEFDGTEIEDPSLAAEVMGGYGDTPGTDPTASGGEKSVADNKTGGLDSLQQIEEIEKHLTPVQRYMMQFTARNSDVVVQEELDEINQQVEAELQVRHT